MYQTSKSNISEHIKHIFEEGELDEVSVVRKFRTAGADGKNYNIIHYNLDMIISLGYRVRSLIATQFRRWATERLKEYMIKGFALDDERLKNLGGGNYWKELLDRIRDIRSSEKVMYRQVLDLYATSVDYDPKSSESVAFFKMVQNKLHYAAHGHTAAEVIYERFSRHPENELEKNNMLNNNIGINKCMSRISMDPHAITDAVNNLSGMSITYSANEIKTIAGQMNSIGKMTHGKIPELVMGGTFTRDSVADYLNTRIFVGG